MKVIEFKHNTGSDWVFAQTMEEAKSFYLRHTGCGDDEDMTVIDIPESEWGNMNIVDTNVYYDDEDIPEDEQGDYEDGFKIIETFADRANRITKTDIIATTEL